MIQYKLTYQCAIKLFLVMDDLVALHRSNLHFSVAFSIYPASEEYFKKTKEC